MTDQAPVSSRHVRIKLHNLASIPERVLDRIEITTEVTQYDRARTTVQCPQTSRFDEQELWRKEMWQALRYLEGADAGIPFAGVSQTFTVEWDGICRPI